MPRRERAAKIAPKRDHEREADEVLEELEREPGDPLGEWTLSEGTLLALIAKVGADARREPMRQLVTQSTAIAVLMRRLGLTTTVIERAEIDAAEGAVDVDVKRDRTGDWQRFRVRFHETGSMILDDEESDAW